MLKRVFSPAEARGFQVRAADARVGALFAHRPEFNPPAHGVWNIVHVGMLVPECHQIYVCGVNCMRGVVLTAAEMGAGDRFSMVILEENDLAAGRVEDATLNGVTAALQKLPALPPAVMVFTVCTHRFLGCDLDFVYRRLEARFPAVRFLRCFMEPITQKTGRAPDERLRKTMFDPLRPCPPRPKTAAVLGSDFALDADADLRRMLAAGGWELREIQGCRTFAEFEQMAEAGVFLSIYPRARWGAQETARRLGRPCLHLPLTFSYAEIDAAHKALCAALDLPALDTGAERRACEDALAAARRAVGGAAVAVDCHVTPRPLGLARLLLAHGFAVKAVYLDAVAPEEADDLAFLQKNAPGLLLASVIQPQARVLPRGGAGPVVAVGPLAAWREATPRFVDMVEGGGLWGYAGIRTLARLIAAAAQTEKDARALIPRKGWGCASCL